MNAKRTIGLRGWTLPAACAVAALFMPLAAGQVQAAEKIRLIVDFADGVQVHFTNLKVAEKSTAIDLLKAAEKHSRGIKSTVRGSGQTALVTSIGKQKNEGRGRDAKNWLYYVNEQRAEIGAGVYELQPGDGIMWKFDTLRQE